jgi:hypothetical protein
MPRLFWTRPVSRVQRSLKVKTGQSTTSFPPETENLITTSTTYSRYVDLVTDASKTGSSNELHGGTNASKRKGILRRVGMALNDLLPVSIRPIKSKRAWRKHRYPLRVQLFTFRMYWHSHLRDKVRRKLRLNK